MNQIKFILFFSLLIIELSGQSVSPVDNNLIDNHFDGSYFRLNNTFIHSPSDGQLQLRDNLTNSTSTLLFDNSSTLSSTIKFNLPFRPNPSILSLNNSDYSQRDFGMAILSSNVLPGPFEFIQDEIRINGIKQSNLEQSVFSYYPNDYYATINVRQSKSVGLENGIAFVHSDMFIENRLGGLTGVDPELNGDSEIRGDIHVTASNGNIFLTPNRSLVSNAGGHVGVNTLSPKSDLHIKQGTGFYGGIILENNNDGNDFWNLDVGTNNLFFKRDADGPGTNNSFISLANINAATGAWQATSDRRMKKDIELLDNTILEKIKNIKPCKYRYVHESGTDKHIGFIAQELNEYFPEFVDDSEEYHSVDYGGLSTIAIKAIQEQQLVIEAQSKEISKLKNGHDYAKNQSQEITELKAQLEAQESIIKSILIRLESLDASIIQKMD